MPDRAHTTAILEQIVQGDSRAVDELYPLVYRELHAVAALMFRDQSSNHTLQPTALVHDAFLKLVDQTDTNWANRAHFIRVATKAMRRILIDHARQQQALKRGGNAQKVTLSSNELVAELNVDVLALEEALERLSKLDPRKTEIVELRFYGGLTITEVGNLMALSPKTIEADWYLLH